MMEVNLPVKVFISYSWDNEDHKEWVRKFATRLRGDGIDITLDRWHAVPGDQLPEFMERAVRQSDFVLCVCTPNYKTKSDQRGGGVGYEGDVMTNEVFANRNQQKFIPVLQRGEWKESAPSWLLGKYYIDLRGMPYSDGNYQDLLSTLRKEREEAPPIGGVAINEGQQDNFEFVNREIELETLTPPKLLDSYWQCALISAPAGYGKSRLLKRLTERFQANPDWSSQWNWCYVDMSKCGAHSREIRYFGEQICQRPFTSNIDTATVGKQVCDHILENLSVHPENDASCGVLLLLDSLDDLLPSSEYWLFSVFNEVITASYIDYSKGNPSFPVRLILAGRNIEAFWLRYKRWEESSNLKYHLRAENLLPLSPFKKTHVESLIDFKARKKRIRTDQLEISDIAEKLLFWSGGHPAVINGILDELIGRRFRQLDDYLGENVNGLINNHITGIVFEVFKNFPLHLQRDIKTVLVFRMVTLDILEELRSKGLILSEDDNAQLLGFLRDNQFLHFDDKMLSYHDDILRRIVYLDFAFGYQEQGAHVQATHKCAVEYYKKLIEQPGEQKSHYFVEWLFHALQINGDSQDDIVPKWKSLLSKIRPIPVLPEDLKRAIEDGLLKDTEIKYIYRERFGVEDYMSLFGN